MKNLKIKTVKAPKGFPSEVFLLGQKWTIKYTSKFPKEKKSDEDDLLGMCYGAENHLILIQIDQDPESMKTTLWHELFHAYISMLMGTMSDEYKKMVAEHEEQVVEMFSVVITDAIRNLPNFWSK